MIACRRLLETQPRTANGNDTRKPPRTSHAKSFLGAEPIPKCSRKGGEPQPPSNFCDRTLLMPPAPARPRRPPRGRKRQTAAVTASRRSSSAGAHPQPLPASRWAFPASLQQADPAWKPPANNRRAFPALSRRASATLTRPRYAGATIAFGDLDIRAASRSGPSWPDWAARPCAATGSFEILVAIRNPGRRPLRLSAHAYRMRSAFSGGEIVLFISRLLG